MDAEQETGPADEAARPGKSSTWWHPLLVRLLEFVLHDAYEVQGEVSVGKLPLRLDVVLIRRHAGELPQRAIQQLQVLVERLNDYTLIEFKSPTDTIETGDLDYLLGCAHLFRSQQQTPIDRTQLTLIILAPSLNAAVKADLRRSGITARQQQSGVHQLDGAMFEMWFIETDQLADEQEPVLALFSRVFLREWSAIIGELSRRGLNDVLYYLVQQVQHFKRSPEYMAMPQQEAEFLDHMTQELRNLVLDDIPLEELKKRVLKDMPVEELVEELAPEQRRKGLKKILPELTPEERLDGIGLRERLAGLSQVEMQQLLEEIQRQQLDQ